MPLIMCPNCQAGMQEVRRNNVDIDICPQCRGVWLDRGELEKLLDTVKTFEKTWHHQDEEYHHKIGKPYKKKRNFFDFFDVFD